MDETDRRSKTEKIEITPEMIEAACDAVFDTHDRFMNADGSGYRLDEELLSLIFTAMTKKREERLSERRESH